MLKLDIFNTFYLLDSSIYILVGMSESCGSSPPPHSQRIRHASRYYISFKYTSSARLLYVRMKNGKTERHNSWSCLLSIFASMSLPITEKLSSRQIVNRSLSNFIINRIQCWKSNNIDWFCDSLFGPMSCTIWKTLLKVFVYYV